MSALSQLRHAYHQLTLGLVKNQKQFADGLIAPAIREMERESNVIPEHVRQLQEQNTHLDKVSAELQGLCDKQAKMLGERDAALKQALQAATDAQDLFGCVETCSRNNFVNLASEQVESLQKAIAAIKEMLK